MQTFESPHLHSSGLYRLTHHQGQCVFKRLKAPSSPASRQKVRDEDLGRKGQTHEMRQSDTMQWQRSGGANGDADREMEIKEGEPTAGQKSSNATAVE